MTRQARSPYPAPRRGMLYYDREGGPWEILTAWRNPHGANLPHTIVAEHMETLERRTVSAMEWRAGWTEARD